MCAGLCVGGMSVCVCECVCVCVCVLVCTHKGSGAHECTHSLTCLPFSSDSFDELMLYCLLLCLFASVCLFSMVFRQRPVSA